MSALRPLLSGIVDYAGLFPPAALDMATAVRNYTDYRRDDASWMLGRFVAPVSRLDELARELRALDGAAGDEWSIAALLGGDVAGDVIKIAAFNEDLAGAARVDVLEGRFTSAEAIARAASVAGDRFAIYAEVPIDREPRELIAAIAGAGINAKVRTGGVTPEAFPSAADVVRFMRRCAEARVQFKATAGLHHPIRAEHRLTYAPDAPSGPMYGYLNVFLTAALLLELTDEEAFDLLEERDPRALTVSRDSIRWRDHELRADQANAAREQIASSFGSCSFREPVDDLRVLSLLP
ncbi:MAG TPA: hypothetical protein VGN65_09945 [Casimicrobiaceae bacterium]